MQYADFAIYGIAYAVVCSHITIIPITVQVYSVHCWPRKYSMSRSKVPILYGPIRRFALQVGGTSPLGYERSSVSAHTTSVKVGIRICRESELFGGKRLGGVRLSAAYCMCMYIWIMGIRPQIIHRAMPLQPLRNFRPESLCAHPPSKPTATIPELVELSC